MNDDKLNERRNRVRQVNELLKVIANRGRRFFWSERMQSYEYINMDKRGRLWFRQASQFPDCQLIYLHSNLLGRRFHHGGTMEALLKALTAFIMSGNPVRGRHLGPWPTWVCGDGDRWGYGAEAMAEIRSEAVRLGVFEIPDEAKTNDPS